MEWNRGNGRKEYIKQIPDEIKAQYFQTNKNKRFQSPEHFKQSCLAAIDTLAGQKITIKLLCEKLNISQVLWQIYRKKPEYCQIFADIEDIIKKRKGNNKDLKETKKLIKRTFVNPAHPTKENLKDEIVLQSFQKISDKLRLGEYDDKQLIEIFKEAVKLSGFLKPDVSINNCLASQKVFITKDDIDKTNQIIEDVLNEQ